MEYCLGDQQVIINFSDFFCKNEVEVLNSECFSKIWEKFLHHIDKIQKQDVLKIIRFTPNPEHDFVQLFKLILEFDLEEICQFHPYYRKILEHRDILYGLIEDFYDYWRRLARYGVVYAKSNLEGIESQSFTNAMDTFTNIVLQTYRTISQKVYGEKFAIYRSLPAGINAGLLISKNIWMKPTSPYAFLGSVAALEQVVIRPPFISYSTKNKRTGIYQEVFENPLEKIGIFQAEDFYCYQAYVGDSLAYVYFHKDFLAHGIALCNLFDFVSLTKCQGKKPDLLYIFGADIVGDSIFYYDKIEDIYLGIAPHDVSVDYFGYMKKMLLTLHNVKMIDQGYLPLHGACVSLLLRNGTKKNIVFVGDSGAGKSESLEALSEIAGDFISEQITVFDDMGTLKIDQGKILAYGTEIGAFVRLDDMTAGYAYREMDRAIFMNPDRPNSRLVVPIATHPQIMKGYPVDMILYANNYENVSPEIRFFESAEEAEEVFVCGRRHAKGTTQENGLVESFFANPFGPVQRKEQTMKLIHTYFDRFFNQNTKVGEIYTKLGILGLEQEGPRQAALKLSELLKSE